MQWSEISEGNGTASIWEIPGSRAKNHRNHLIPLSTGACEVLGQIPKTGPLVFSTTGTSPVSGFGKARARMNEWISTNELMVSPWTLHDLRRTMVTIMNEHLQIAPHVVEAVVNHVSGEAKRGVAGIYNRALYLQERRDALERWARYIRLKTGTSEN
jgi:integrase